MAHLDKRIDPDKQTGTKDGGRAKDGVSGNVNESLAYENNKTEDLPDGPAPDVPGGAGRPGGGAEPREPR